MSVAARPAAPAGPTRPPRSGRRSAIELAYVAAFVATELVGLAQPLAGAALHAVLILALINHYVLAERDNRHPLMLALAAVCLYRLLAFTPLPSNAFSSHLVVVGVPMLLATILALRVLRDSGIGLPSHPWTFWRQMGIFLMGIPLSYVAYKLLKPAVVVTFAGPGKAHTTEVVVAVLGLAIFSGLGEELLFRALLHRAARTTFGGSALYVSTAVFGAAYLGSRSMQFVLFAVAVGAFFGWCYEKTGSIVGVALAHAVISIGVFVVWPTYYAQLLHP